MDNGVVKPWLSKTIIVSAVAGLLGAVSAFWPNANFALTWLNQNGAVVAMVWGVVGIVLRLVTKGRISLGD